MLIFDGHNDTLLRLLMAASADGGSPQTAAETFARGRSGHLDLPGAVAGGFQGGLFAIFVPTPSERALLDLGSEEASAERKRPRFNRDSVPYAPSVGIEESCRVAEEALEMARLLERRGDVQWVLTARELEEASRQLDADEVVAPLLGILHFEGAEPVREDLSNLEHWFERGVRSIGLVWSRRNRFAAGVPFRFPSHPDHYDGLTPAGFDLVRACDDLGVLLDLAHLNEKGFWDVQRTTRQPLVVSHSAALSICPSSRNITDDQIRAVGESGGLIGVNLHCGDVRPDGRLNPDTPISDVVQHVELIAELAGIEHVALGSDFDGALMPRSIGSAAGLPNLLKALSTSGFSDEELALFAWRNWTRVLANVLPRD